MHEPGLTGPLGHDQPGRDVARLRRGVTKFSKSDFLLWFLECLVGHCVKSIHPPFICQVVRFRCPSSMGERARAGFGSRLLCGGHGISPLRWGICGGFRAEDRCSSRPGRLHHQSGDRRREHSRRGVDRRARRQGSVSESLRQPRAGAEARADDSGHDLRCGIFDQGDCHYDCGDAAGGTGEDSAE